MKSMNRKESKKIAVMAAIIMGFMMFAFMPMASAAVTSFTVTPSTGLAGAVDSYNALVTTDGVTTIDITIPKGFIAVTPTTGGVEIARVDFWNSSTKTYYGYATITANDTNPTTKVDIFCKFGDDAIGTTQNVDYAAGELNIFMAGFEGDDSSARIRLPTEDDDGSIKVSITCTAFQLDDVMIAIKQFVRNPGAGDYVFSADGVDETVTITAAGGRGIVFRNGQWYVDTDGDHIADKFFMYGQAGDIPLIGNFGSEDTAVFRGGVWFIDTTGNHVSDQTRWLGQAGDKPVVGDLNFNGEDRDIGVFRNGMWYCNTTGGSGVDLSFLYGAAGDIPIVADFNNDGTDDIVVFRNGAWFIDTDGDRIADKAFWLGDGSYKPVAGDIDQDGTTDAAVFKNGVWFVRTNPLVNPNIDQVFWYGLGIDIPLVGYL